MKLLYYLFFFLIFIIAVLFSIKNLQPVPIDFYYARFELPLALVLTLELLAGVIIGLIVGFIRVITLKARCAKLSRQVVSTQRKLEELRALAPDQPD